MLPSVKFKKAKARWFCGKFFSKGSSDVEDSFVDHDFPDNQFFEDDYSQSNSEMYSDEMSDPPPSDELVNPVEEEREGFSPT